jgi:hypothetical protein
VDDRTDDRAFGAMMLLALRPKFRKLRFQMIDDSQHAFVAAPCQDRRGGSGQGASQLLWVGCHH